MDRETTFIYNVTFVIFVVVLCSGALLLLVKLVHFTQLDGTISNLKILKNYLKLGASELKLDHTLVFQQNNDHKNTIQLVVESIKQANIKPSRSHKFKL